MVDDVPLEVVLERCRDLAEDLRRQIDQVVRLLKPMGTDDPHFAMACLTQLQRAGQAVNEAMLYVVSEQMDKNYPDLFRRPPEGKGTP